MESLPNLATSAGIAVVVLILIGAFKTATSFDAARWGALLAIALGVVLSFGNVLLGGVVPGTEQAPIVTILTGIVGGASASGIYEAGKGVASSSP